MTGKISGPWSFSRLKTYEQCPRKARYIYVDGLKEPSNKWSKRGTEVHTEAETYLGGVGHLPESLAKLRKDFLWLKKEGPFSEIPVAVTEDWKKCLYGGPEAWVRGKIDALLVADPFIIIDFKTGKERDYHREQLEVYAATCFVAYPHTDTITGELWYVDTGVVRSMMFYRSDLEEYKAKWAARAKPMLTDETFPFGPSPLCQYCHFRKENGGPCEF